MESVAAQPTSPVIPSGARNSASRIAQLFNPLRKSTSVHDLGQLHGYEDYAQQPSQSLSPLEQDPNQATFAAPVRSTGASPYNTPPTSFGFSSKARIGRALAEGSGDRKNREDDYYIPYRGPITPPSHATSTFTSTQSMSQGLEEGKAAAERRLYLHLNRYSKPLPDPETGLPMVQGQGAGKGEVPRYRDVESRQLGMGSGLGLGLMEGLGDPSRSATTTAQRSEAASSPSKAPRSLLGTGLPSAYTHGGNTPPLDPGFTPRSLGYQSYVPSLLRFDRDAEEKSTTRKREVMIANQPTTTVRHSPSASTLARGRPSSSANNSPLMASTPLRSTFSTERSHQPKTGSITSSDGHGSSLVNEGSASTSMTSLREYSSSGFSNKVRPSQDGRPPLSASAKQRSRANTTSSLSDKGRVRVGLVEEASRELPSSFRAAETRPPIVARDFVGKEREKSGTPSSYETGHEDTWTEQSMDRGEDTLLAARPLSLSPIPASMPGHQSDVLVSPNGQSTAGNSKQSGERESETSEARARRVARMQEAHRKYLLLQQLHLDELTLHAPDHAGWLDAKNGCERVLMPKPSLKGREGEGYEGEAGEGRGEGGRPVMASFERHRRPHSKSSPDLADQARVQEILSRTPFDPASARRNFERSPLFHHRMPPPVPNEPYQPYRSSPLPPKVPTRRSSHTQRARRDTLGSTRSPLLFEDDLDTDLATVFAQGKALEEERERWREEHRRSIMAKTRPHSSGRGRSKDGKKVRYSQEPLPDLAMYRRHAGSGPTEKETLRQAKSSPDLRKTTVDLHASRGSEAVSPRCLPFLSLSSNRRRHERSKSQDALPSAFDSDDQTGCFPPLSRRRRAKTLTSEGEKSTRLSNSSMQSSGSRDVRYSTAFVRAPGQQTRLASDEPYIISQEGAAAAAEAATATAAVTSEVQQGGSSSIDRFRFPHRQDQRDHASNSKGDAYGVAFSAPRPDIGHRAPKDETFVAGRHATKQGYHRPSNSDDLRIMLANPKAKRKPVSQPGESSLGPDQGRSSAVRSDSLGMSEVAQTIEGERMAASQSQPQAGTQLTSLPVPPRKQRVSASSRPGEGEGHVHEPQGPSPHFATPFIAVEGFGPSTAFATPTLEQGAGVQHRAGFFAGPEERRSTESEARLSLRQSSEDHRLLGPSIYQTLAERRGNDIEAVQRQGRTSRLVGHSSSSSDSSSYSPRSVAARELWNTDEHPEESFSGLFFRRPTSTLRTTMAAVEQQGLGQGEGESKGSVTPKQGKDKSRDESLYRASLHGRRDSKEVELLVGSYLDDGSTVEGQEGEGMAEAAWNDSTIDVVMTSPLQRQTSARMGRIDDQRPTIRHTRPINAQELPVTVSDDDGPEFGLAASRARLGSFAASLVLTSEGDDGSPVEESHPPMV